MESSKIGVDLTPKEDSKEVKVSFEGVSFNFSQGSSLTIGEVKTDTLDLKGLKSVHIDCIEEGSIKGMTLIA
jgi:hypothetical protein